MQWQDEAIIIAIHKYSENSAIITCFCKEMGVYAAMAKGAMQKRNKYIYQIGNLVNVTWTARMREHMGSYNTELVTSYSNKVMFDKHKLTGLHAACNMLKLTLLDRNPSPAIYQQFLDFIEHIIMTDHHYDDNHSNMLQSIWIQKYLLLELELISEIGFGLDLSKCAATGQNQELIYVSPKSGRAVCKEAGEEYKDKLLLLPNFIKDYYSGINAHYDQNMDYDIISGFKLTEHFLNKYYFLQHNLTMPFARKKLYDYCVPILEKSAKAS